MNATCEVCEGRGWHGELRERCIACHGAGNPCAACSGAPSPMRIAPNANGREYVRARRAGNSETQNVEREEPNG